MKNFFTIVVALTLILINTTALASEKLIEASGSYVMDSRLDETPASATARAREEAKRSAVEKAGVYLQNYSKMIDFELKVDEVETVAAGLLKIQNESSNIDVVENNLLRFTVTIEALIDELSENDLKALLQDKQSLEELTRKNKELQEKYDELNRQMKQYREKFDGADAAQKEEIKKDVALNSEKFAAVNEFAKGNEFSFRKDYEQALASYDRAISLNPQLAEAYNNRGVIRYELEQFSAAIEDYTQAIKLKSNYVDALNNRGNACAAVGQLQNAERDFRAALKLNDNSAVAHNNLGNVHLSRKNFDEAVKEYTRAIELYQNYAAAYYNRAVVYYSQGNMVKALLDLRQSINLNPSDTRTKAFYEKISRQ